MTRNTMTTVDLSPLEQELRKLEKDKVIKLPLADLVMMQMVGNFPQFLNALSRDVEQQSEEQRNAALDMIEDTRNAVTTPKLFPGIVQKTITAQFGVKHAALCALGQNAIDSYSVEAEEKKVIFDLRTEKNYHLLRVRDSGAGMDSASLVKNLLIPYNSGKEFDPNKIGEHGIGWYSIVDLSEVVKVTTKTAEMDAYVQALIYKEGEEWMASLSPSPGVQNELLQDKSLQDKSLSGAEAFSTEVLAYVSKDTTSVEGMRNYLFQHLGLVDTRRAKIFLGTEAVNTVRDQYQAAAPVNVHIDESVGQLTMSISKRTIRDLELKDSRFVHRNKNLNQAVFTQHGLFVNYDSMGFDAKSMHQEFLRKLQTMGLDLWVDLPANVTLTKGRNNIIADHAAPVLEAQYQAFENLFLDVILSDDELLYHSSGIVLEQIADLFDKTYKRHVTSAERNSYSLGRRVLSRTAAIAVGTLEVGYYMAYALYRAAKYGAIELPQKIGRAAMSVKAGFEEEEDKDKIKRIAGKTVKIGVPAAAGVGAAGYGIYKLQDTYDWDPFIYTGAALASLVAFGVVAMYGPRVVKGIPHVARSAGEAAGYFGRAFYEWARSFELPKFGRSESGKKSEKSLEQRLREETSKEALLPRIGHFCKSVYMSALNSMGLYVDVEAKRRAKLEKKLAKISKQYLSKMQKDHFFAQLLNKKIIYAERYFDASIQDHKNSIENSIETVGDWMRFPIEGHYASASARKKKVWQEQPLQKTVTKISIDELVKLHLERRIKYDDPQKRWLDAKCGHGDYYVNYNNPVVRKVVENLEEIAHKVRKTYDVKVLEDRLDTLGEFAQSLGLLVYLCSGIGVVHAIYSENSDKVQNPFKDFKPYRAIVSGGKAVAEAFRDREWASDLYQNAKIFLKYAVLIPTYYLPKYSLKLGAGAVKYSAREWFIPGAKALNPVRYPGYARDIAQYVRDWQEERMKKGIERMLAQADQVKQLPQHAQESDKEQLKKEQSEKETKEGLFKRLLNYCLEQFTINFITGLGPAPFDTLSADDLKAITARAHAGQLYADFTSALQDVNEIVAHSMSEKPYLLYLSYRRKGDDYEIEHSSGMHLRVNKRSKEPKLYLDLSECHRLLKLTQDLTAEQQDPAALTELSYTLLDLVIHQRAHDSLHYYRHKFHNDDDKSLHPRKFLDRKEKIRREVVSKMAENNISLPEIIGQRIPYVDQKENPKYVLLEAELAELVHLPRFRQPHYLEIKRNEERKRTERQMRNLGPGGGQYRKE